MPLCGENALMINTNAHRRGVTSINEYAALCGENAIGKCAIQQAGQLRRYGVATAVSSDATAPLVAWASEQRKTRRSLSSSFAG